MAEQIHIMVRTCFQTWRKVAVVDSLEAAERYWKDHINGRGMTAWTEFVPEHRLTEFLQTGISSE
jgi:hypothetical protein